jgi:[ribosomal protein S18]-alanine N-acetyltransferase
MQAPGEKISTSPSIAVRTMSAQDVTAALSILEESPEASLWSRESLLESAAQGTAWAADINGCVAGILIARAAADELEILNLAVAKSCRRRGVATKLVKFVLQAAHSAGATQAFLEVRASNQGGIALYTRLGFRFLGRRPNYYRNPVEDAALLVFDKFETIS